MPRRSWCSVVARTSLSNLLRSSLLDRPTSSVEPRIFGGQRVLRGDQVGVQRPISLSVPVNARALLEAEVLLEQEEATPAPPPPDFAAIEEAARLQGYSIGYEQGMA